MQIYAPSEIKEVELFQGHLPTILINFTQIFWIEDHE